MRIVLHGRVLVVEIIGLLAVAGAAAFFGVGLRVASFAGFSTCSPSKPSVPMTTTSSSD